MNRENFFSTQVVGGIWLLDDFSLSGTYRNLEEISQICVFLHLFLAVAVLFDSGVLS